MNNLLLYIPQMDAARTKAQRRKQHIQCTQPDKHAGITARRCEEGSDGAPRWRSRALEGSPFPGPHTSEHPALASSGHTVPGGRGTCRVPTWDPLPHLLDHGLGNKIPEALATGPESACTAWVASSLGPLPRSDHFYSTDFVGMMGGQEVSPGRGSGWSLKVGLAWSLVV